MSQDAMEFLNENAGGEGFPALKFEKIGDGYKGTITKEPRPVTRKNLNDGSPEKQLPINLKVDGEDRTLWVRAGFLAGAIQEAVATSGATGLQVGGTLTVQMIELRDTGKPQPAKVFRAKYEAPASSGTSVGDLFDDANDESF